MKKTGLFKIIMFVLLGVVAFTWIFSASYYTDGALTELGMYQVGFFDYFQLIFASFEFSYFIQILILLVSIGALYGVLNKTGKYRAWIEKIAGNFKGAELIFMIIIAFIIAALSSAYDYGFMLFIFFPFVISIILAMGYDKITACVCTFGALLVGTIGNTLGYSTSGIIVETLGTKLATGIVFKLVLFVLALGVLIFYLYKAKINKKAKNDEEDLFLGEKISNKYSIAPIIVILCTLFVLLVLGCTNWSSTFGVEAFTKFNDKIAAVEVKLPHLHITSEGFDVGMEKVAIFKNLLGTVSALGEWYYAEMGVMCLLAALLVGAFYGMKFKDRFEYMAEGAKKMLPSALMIMLAYAVVYFAGNTMFYPTIASFILGITEKFNVFLSSIAMILASALHVDMLYVANYALPQIVATDGNTTLITLLTQGMYGVTMFIAPTSAVLVLGLTYLNIPYKEWIKKTWKLTLALFATVAVVLVAAMIIL